MTRDEKYSRIIAFVSDFGPTGVSSQAVGDALYSKLKEPARGKPPTKPESERALEWARRNLRRCSDMGMLFYDNRTYRWVSRQVILSETFEDEPVTLHDPLDTLREQSTLCRGALEQAQEKGSITLADWLLVQLLEEALRVGGSK